MADKEIIPIPEDLSTALIGGTDVRLAVTTYHPLASASISNIAMGTKLNEITVVFGATVQQFEIRMRKSKAFRIAFNAGETATLYTEAHNFYVSPMLTDQSTFTIYLASNKASDTAEVITWT